MKKPITFKANIYVNGSILKNSDILYNICDQYNFIYNYELNNFVIIGEDSIYESIEYRIVFLLKALKKEAFEIKYYTIEAVVYNSKIYGELNI